MLVIVMDAPRRMAADNRGGREQLVFGDEAAIVRGTVSLVGIECCSTSTLYPTDIGRGSIERDGT